MTMPICRTCNGKGTCRVNYLNDRMIDIKCIDCKGTGEYPPLLTNEEWFCQLSTEEKAKFFHGIVIRAMQATWDGKKPDYPAYLSDWKMWLKEVHE